MTERKKALLVGVQTKDINNIEYSMEELHNLAEAAEYEIVDSVIQTQLHTHQSTYVGTGKLEEIADYVEDKKVDVVICNDELSPLQIRQMEEVLPCELLDRTLLILDIFAKRAKTKEAMLQVEIAGLQYMLPRLIGSRMELGRQGGSGGGLHNRGSGETKLELDMRNIKTQISRKKKELRELVENRQTARKKRKKSEHQVIALVGYTNAGKSTLMNTLLRHSENDKEVFVKDMLFATLETKTRKITLPHKYEAIISDTVGFVDKLPHYLVQAFRSTLEEVKEADILLHVIDYSNPFYHEQMQTTLSVLEEIGVHNIPILNVYNKLDKTDMKFPYKKKHKVFISAYQDIGIDMLLEEIENELYGEIKRIEVFIPYQDSKMLHSIYEDYDVLYKDEQETGVILQFHANNEDINKMKSYMRDTTL